MKCYSTPSLVTAKKKKYYKVSKSSLSSDTTEIWIM